MKTTVNYEKRGNVPSTIRQYVLLSTSPRRQELLAFLRPELLNTDINERNIEKYYMNLFKDKDFLDRAANVCCEIAKAKSSITMKEGTLYISANTMIISDNKIHHKPQTLEEAKITLTSYFGKSHYSVTGVCLKAKGYQEVFYTVAKIDFIDYYDELEEAIDHYIATYKPLDRAGSYSIRDIDPRFIKGITGDIHTIIGLPVAELSYRLFGNKSFE